MNYLINGTAPDLFVINDMGAVMGGPYKNEESAKRRIRDLKRKDNEQIAIVADMQATGMMPVETASTPVVASMDNYVPLRCTAKLAMSSEYGKSKLFTVTPINGFEIRETFIPRQVGCYPAISKHAYRR